MEPAGNLDDHQILIENAGLELILFDYVKCEEIIKYVDLESYDEGQIVGASLSSDGRSLVYALSSSLEEEDIEYIINIMDTQSMEVRAIGSGVYPSWSPDDQWIAYVGWDGIRMMESDGMHDRLIVEYDSTIDYPLRGMGFMTTSPIPQWSPDGEWLVYHKCTSVTKDCEYIKVFSIFKFELSTGREFLILEGGAYPDWKGD